MLGGGKIRLKCDPSFGLIKIGAFRNNIYSLKHDYTKISIEGEVIFHGHATFYSGSRVLVTRKGILNIGRDFEIGSQTSIIAVSEISFGDNVMISWDVLIMDSDLHSIYDHDENLLNKQRAIHVGNDVWIGCRCCILKGVDIPDGNIISASSLITKTTIYEKSILTSSRVIRSEITWNRKLNV